MGNLTFVSFVYVVLTYTAFAIFIVGVAWRIILYAKTPMCVKIPITPAPKTSTGAFFRLMGEVLFFKTLFKSDKKLWLAGYVFHVSLAMVMAQHLLRHYVYDFSHGHPPAWYNTLIPIGVFFGVLMFISLAYLLLRRIFIDRVRFVSIFADYFILILLMAITVAGLSEILCQPADQLEKAVLQLDIFFNKLLMFSPVNIPTNPYFLVHYTLVLILIAYIPFSKIMHFVGIFFSPTITMTDDVREKRYFNEKADRLTL